MARFATALLVALAMAFVTPARAGEFNKKINIGDAAPTFKDLEGTDGKKHSLSDFKKDVVVLVFISNSCTFATAYEDRIIAFAKKYGAKVDVVALNVSTIPEDRLDKMTAHAKEKGFNFAYLYDPSQKIGRALGATVTPEFFVLNKDRKVVYMGAMDDTHVVAKVTKKYLEQAVEAALKGEKPATAETAARGCSIEYEKNSR